MEKTGAQVVIDFLRHHNVDLVFGYPGGAILPIYDELYRSGIRHILCRHEQGAIHAAEGYAKVSGKLGVVFATSGPGATNLVTGLADAKMDSVPILAITGQVSSHLIGTDAFQEADIYGISIPITKSNRLVKDVDILARVLEESYVVAMSGRPGPALVDIPKDVQSSYTKELDFVVDDDFMLKYRDKEIVGDLDALVDAINRSERPLMYVGGGANVSGAGEEISLLARRSGIPVVMTLMGLGALSSDNEFSLGMLGMHGSKYANYSVTHCDLLIALGARFDDRVTGKLETFAKQARVAHVDIDRAEIGKLVQIDYPIVGDLKKVLQSIISSVEHRVRDSWLNDINKRKKKHPFRYRKDGDLIKPQYFIEELSVASGGEAIVATDVGQHQMWVAQYYGFKNARSIVTSGGLGTMGFGFPAAMGASLAYPDKLVVALSGDGSFQMNIQELATCSMYGMNVKVVVLNNGFLGMVRQWQELFYDSKFSHSDFDYNPDFVGIAKAYGIDALSISRKDEVKGAIKDFLLSGDKSVLLEVKIPSQEKVFPMIPAGGSLDDSIDIDDLGK